MKPLLKTFSLLFVTGFLLLLGACSNPDGEMGTITINVEGRTARWAGTVPNFTTLGYPAYEINLLQNNISVKSATVAQGDSSAYLTVEPGEYTLKVDAYLNSYHFATYSDVHIIDAGPNTITVNMERLSSPAIVITQDDGSGGTYTFPAKVITYTTTDTLTLTVINFGGTATGPLTIDLSSDFTSVDTLPSGDLVQDGSFILSVSPILGLVTASSPYTSTIRIRNASGDPLTSFEVEFSVTGTLSTVTFDLRGGTSTSPLDQTVVTGGFATEPTTTPTRDPSGLSGWYDFDGWYKEAALTNPWLFNTDTVEANTTLYAKWKPLKLPGETGPGGGIIFYVEDAGPGFTVDGYGTAGVGSGFATYTAHYLEAAPANATNSSWIGSATASVIIPETTGITTFTSTLVGVRNFIGKGRRDTQIIVAFYADITQSTNVTPVSDTAANRAVGYRAPAPYDTIDDWFLPSIGELDVLYIHENVTPDVGMGTNMFWSSSQYNAINAWRQNASNRSYAAKDITHFVRAIRAF